MPYLAKILVYPIKSLDGVEVSQASLWEGGAIAHDREFALVDESGKVVNAKRKAEIHKIRTAFDLDARMITLWLEGNSAMQSFHLDGDRPALEGWFSDYFGFPITLRQNCHMGFPDDIESSGPTIVSVASLEAIATWFGMGLDECRQRFRANLEIANVPAFWEDTVFDAAGEGISFQIGDVVLKSSHPCQRCIVPTRNPWTGDRTPDFQTKFNIHREATLPDGVPRTQFNHFYKLTLNTQVSPLEAGKVLRLGDRVRL
ncbi:MAG: MOSC N-terminal beta barrel domain-containing protein [Oscillatoriophycideae cyanobacterium NC_groundwater_1537_Pr4_S-0.65um_50_18]|nr:MOSC N-terminal beta barrel domain-containing protein [Oscillatoriophycideae cyanobacterium NC_groundwater_1537_Pr4_S-0.65um_50_18]